MLASALHSAATTFETQAEHLAGEIEVLSGLGIHSGGEGLDTGDGDLNSLIGGKLDEIIEALAGEGEHLQQTSKNLNIVLRNYQNTDGHVADKINAIHW
jgi:ABC-type transporter Mla subunit MlaD